MEFMNYPKVHDVQKGTTIFADVVNHCEDYQNFMVADSKVTSCHECTHGCNNDIRNKAGGRVNGFYLGADRAIVVPEPKIRKRDAVPFIPSSLQGYRYSLYVTGQSDWDDQPLYLYDEFVAYINGTWAAIDLKRKENYVESGRVIDGSVEFVSYAVAVLMAADKAGDLQPLLTEFSKWLLRHAYNSYFESQKDFDSFAEQDKAYQEQKSGSSWADHRAFLLNKLGYKIPEGVEPDGNEDISWDI